GRADGDPRGGPGGRLGRVAHVLHDLAAAARTRHRHGGAVRHRGHLEQLFPAPDHAQRPGPVPADARPVPVARRRVRHRRPAGVQPGHHRLVPHDRADRDRLPAAAALLAVRPERRRREGLTRPRGPELRRRGRGKTMTITRTGRVAAGALTALLAVSLTACSGGGGDGGGGAGATADEIEAALQEGGSLTYWTWTPQAEKQIEEFEKAYPDVDVTLVDTVGAGESNTKLQNAIAAGKGVPDVVQIEYQSIPQFQLPGQLVDLTQYGFDELESLYTPSTWGAVSQNGGIWGLPQDSGPMAFFYNQEVFDDVGVEVPTTWDEYIEVARAVKEDDPDRCLANDSGDPGFTTSMIWQAGGTPFQNDGESVTIDLADEGTTRFAEMYQPLIDDELLCRLPGWSDEWYAALNDGTIASVALGAWMPGILEDGVPDGAGKWRVAPMPTYDGTPTNAENGGSTESIPGAAENKLLAAGFLKW